MRTADPTSACCVSPSLSPEPPLARSICCFVPSGPIFGSRSVFRTLRGPNEVDLWLRGSVFSRLLGMKDGMDGCWGLLGAGGRPVAHHTPSLHECMVPEKYHYRAAWVFLHVRLRVMGRVAGWRMSSSGTVPLCDGMALGMLGRTTWGK
jgi:hypothetical protein